MDWTARTPHMRPMSERRGNIFRFRKLKWGAPKRLDGLKAIGLESGPPPVPARGPGIATIGLVVAGVAGGFAIGMALLGVF